MAAGNANGVNSNGTRPSGPRCIALVGPFQSGKTTLLEAILARTGAIQRQGSVDAGSTVGDGSKEARDHRMGVELSVATTSFMGDSYTFIDCPGSVEFLHDTTLCGLPPRKNVAMSFATMRAISARVSSVADPRCGRSTTLESRSRRGFT